MVVGEISEGVEVVVVGAGPAGYSAAIRAAQLGKEVVLVEETGVGGTCLNRGCIPSKALIHAADLYHTAQNSEEMGINSGDLEIDFSKTQEWNREIVEKLTGGVEKLEENYGVEISEGHAEFRGSGKIHISSDEGGRTLNFDQCIIATGSKPIEIPGIEFDGETVISSKEALELEEIPDKIVIVGGGYIGMELGMVYQKLGSQVTVIEADDRILSNQDREASEAVNERAEELGMDINTGVKAEEAEVEGDGAVLKTGSGSFEADKILVAVGRQPNTERLGLENTDISKDENGFIEVDEGLETGQSGVFAIGDVAGQPMLAHKGYREGKMVAEIASGEAGVADYQAVPACVYTDPEIAEVGLSKNEAEEEGYSPVVGRFSFSASGRAMTLDRTRGFVKLVASEEENVLLGATICGPHASDLISELALAIEMGALVEDIALTIHPHPTLSEAVMEAAEDLLGRPVHKYKE
ncbi:MAG: dihydrolipoyl dehydrogenase [Candidatus Nanohaloarchaea archaeon]|nr:dihydrolipoyl dehydrogenase [Candidatus Nanohaloarchaea archaeon]